MLRDKLCSYNYISLSFFFDALAGVGIFLILRDMRIVKCELMRIDAINSYKLNSTNCRFPRRNYISRYLSVRFQLNRLTVAFESRDGFGVGYEYVY